MTKEQIHRTVKALPLSAESYWLVMGAALVMHGIREETRDIDIGCTPEAFDALIKLGYHATTSRSGLRKLSLSTGVTVYEGFYTQDIICIDGVPVSDLTSIKRIKAFFGRKKDLADVEQINLHLARMNHND